MCGMIGQILFNVYLILFDLPVFFIAKLGLCCCASQSKLLNKITLTCVKLAWGLSFLLSCCWVRLRLEGVNEMRVSLKQGAGKRPTIVIQNHLSFLDTILAVYLAPTSRIGEVKMMASEHLFKMPVLGTLVSACGHLSVPFKSQGTVKSEEGRGSVGDFTVDKDAVKVVMEQFEAHIASGGIGAWFPEGRMNPEPTKLQLFRKGAFEMAVRHDCEIWCVVTGGVGDCWHRKAPLGGKPARIHIKAFKLCSSSHEFAGEEEGDKSLFLANTAQAQMQAELDDIMNAGWVLKPKLKDPVEVAGGEALVEGRV